MDGERIKELRELCDGATEGPWKIGRGVPPYGTPDEEYVCETCMVALWDTKGAMYRHGDAAFIAASRTALPEALDAIEKLTAERDAMLGLLRERPVALSTSGIYDVRAWDDRVSAALGEN